MRGIPRAPRDGMAAPASTRTATPARLKTGAPMREQKDHQLHARVCEADMRRTAALSKELGISTSELVRMLLQLPADDAAHGERFVVLDTACADRMFREMRHWGYQRNQGMHALNSIAYYLRSNSLDAMDVMDGYAAVHARFDDIEETAKELAPKVEALAQARFLYR